MVTTAWLVAGVTLLLIAVLGIALLLAFTVKDGLGRAGRVDRRVRADTYTETSWVGDLLGRSAALSFRGTHNSKGRGTGRSHRASPLTQEFTRRHRPPSSGCSRGRHTRARQPMAS